MYIFEREWYLLSVIIRSISTNLYLQIRSHTYFIQIYMKSLSVSFSVEGVYIHLLSFISLVHNSRQLFTFWGLFSYNVQSDLSCHFGNSRSKTKVVVQVRKTWLLFFPERAQQLSTGCVWYCSSAPLKGWAAIPDTSRHFFGGGAAMFFWSCTAPLSHLEITFLFALNIPNKGYL